MEYPPVEPCPVLRIVKENADLIQGKSHEHFGR